MPPAHFSALSCRSCAPPVAPLLQGCTFLPPPQGSAAQPAPDALPTLLASAAFAIRRDGSGNTEDALQAAIVEARAAGHRSGGCPCLHHTLRVTYQSPGASPRR